jgi:hypothetical protein
VSCFCYSFSGLGELWWCRDLLLLIIYGVFWQILAEIHVVKIAVTIEHFRVNDRVKSTIKNGIAIIVRFLYVVQELIRLFIGSLKFKQSCFLTCFKSLYKYL